MTSANYNKMFPYIEKNNSSKLNYKKDLLDLKNSILSGKYSHSGPLFNGADVEILFPDSPKIKKQKHYFDNDMRIITKFAKELSGIFFKLRDIAYKYHIIDWSTKLYFFGELGNSINEIIKNKNKDYDLDFMLVEAIGNAEKILGRILSRK